LAFAAEEEALAAAEAEALAAASAAKAAAEEAEAVAYAAEAEVAEAEAEAYAAEAEAYAAGEAATAEADAAAAEAAVVEVATEDSVEADTGAEEPDAASAEIGGEISGILDESVALSTVEDDDQAGLDALSAALNESAGAAAEPELILVTCPEGVAAGELLLVTTPDGREVEVEVPEGVAPGEEFEALVEDEVFEPDPEYEGWQEEVLAEVLPLAGQLLHATATKVRSVPAGDAAPAEKAVAEASGAPAATAAAGLDEAESPGRQDARDGVDAKFAKQQAALEAKRLRKEAQKEARVQAEAEAAAQAEAPVQAVEPATDGGADESLDALATELESGDADDSLAALETMMNDSESAAAEAEPVVEPAAAAAATDAGADESLDALAVELESGDADDSLAALETMMDDSEPAAAAAEPVVEALGVAVDTCVAADAEALVAVEPAAAEAVADAEVEVEAARAVPEADEEAAVAEVAAAAPEPAPAPAPAPAKVKPASKPVSAFQRFQLSKKLKEQKMILLGDCNVGKSSLLRCLIEEDFQSVYETTVGIEHHKVELTVRDVTIKLQVWDLAGASSFGILSKAFLKNAKGAMIVYDVTSEDSFARIPEWVDKIRAAHPDCPLFLCGNKIDAGEIVVDAKDAKSICKQHNICGYSQVSAKNGDNVQIAFDKLGTAVALANPASSEFPESLLTELRAEVGTVNTATLAKDADILDAEATADADLVTPRPFTIVGNTGFTPSFVNETIDSDTSISSTAIEGSLLDSMETSVSSTDTSLVRPRAYEHLSIYIYNNSSQNLSFLM
jgi:small GTP-binding protein